MSLSPPAADPHPEELSLGRREVALVVAFWLLFAVVSVVNRLVDPRRPAPVSAIWSVDVMMALAQSAVWALLTVPLFLLAARGAGARDARAAPLVPLVIAGVIAGVLAALVAGAVTDLARGALYEQLPRPSGGMRGPPRGARAFGIRIGGIQFLNHLVIASGVIAAGLARAYSLRYRARQAQAARLQAQLAEARLDALRRQLDPHFLFNTLHAVSTLVERDPRGVRRMITRLSELLRHSIDGASVPEVPLRQELELLGRYLDIMQVRFQGRLEVETRVDDRTLDSLVPNMILQPLAENAIRHGIERQTRAGRLVVETACEGETVILRVRDDGPGPSDDAPSDGRAGGVGVRNTIERLRQLYGDAGSFTLRADPDGGAVAEVRLPHHTRGDLYVAALDDGRRDG